MPRRRLASAGAGAAAGGGRGTDGGCTAGGGAGSGSRGVVAGFSPRGVFGFLEKRPIRLADDLPGASKSRRRGEDNYGRSHAGLERADRRGRLRSPSASACISPALQRLATRRHGALGAASRRFRTVLDPRSRHGRGAHHRTAARGTGSLATHVIAALGGAPAVDVCMTLFVQNAASAWKPSAILGDDCPDAASISAGISALSPRWLHVLASGDCASYATLPGAVLPCHNSSSWLQPAWVDQCLRRADGDAGRAYEYFARVRPDYFFARGRCRRRICGARRRPARCSPTAARRRRAATSSSSSRARSTTAGGGRASAARSAAPPLTAAAPAALRLRPGLLAAAAAHARVAQAFGVYAGIARTATDVWVRMNATLGGAAAASAGAASDAASAHEEQRRRRGAVRARTPPLRTRATPSRCAAAAEAMRNGSGGADAVARAVRRERRRPHR